MLPPSALFTVDSFPLLETLIPTSSLSLSKILFSKLSETTAYDSLRQLCYFDAAAAASF
jgi:hypothetical protein